MNLPRISLKTLLYFFFFVILLVLIAEGSYFLGFKRGGKGEKPLTVEEFPTSVGQVTEKDLPISLGLLQNPVIYEWRGSVEGRIVSKEDHLFGLEDSDGNLITITDITPSGDIWKTTFVKIPEDCAQPECIIEMSLEEILVGTKIRGDVWIKKGGKDTPIGGRFTIIE